MKFIKELPLKETLRQSLYCGRRGTTAGCRRRITRLQAFAIHGCKCVRCGRVGDRIIMWRANDAAIHVDLFTKTAQGDLLMMSRDHVLPKSLGGPNDVFNFQTMCVHCNTHKGAKASHRDQSSLAFRNRWRNIYIWTLPRVRRWMSGHPAARLVQIMCDLYLLRVTRVLAKVTT